MDEDLCGGQYALSFREQLVAVLYLLFSLPGVRKVTSHPHQ